jgi:polyketide cyclase/dehydrase/lipid transport protein
VAKAFYSVVLDHSADEVWAVIRPFGHYAWAGVEGEVIVEEGKADDQVGAVRRISMGGNVRRQKLLKHSDLDRSYTFCFVGPAPFPIHDYEATIRVTPVAETGQAFVEFFSTFDCALEERSRWVSYLEKEGYAKWLGALRRFMPCAESHAYSRAS